jgi:hypothetical protein
MDMQFMQMTIEGMAKTAAMEYGYMGKGDGFLLMVRDMKKPH